MSNFNETTEVEYRPVVFNVVRGTRSNLLLRIGECRRTISRWSNGNEVLTSYERIEHPRTFGPFIFNQLHHTTEADEWRVDTQEELRERIATDLYNDHDNGSNYNWQGIAEFVAGFVHGQGLVGENFNLRAEMVLVDQAVADQDDPYWQPYFENELNITNNQRVPDVCPMCLKSVANARARIGLECGHVFCKDCLYEWVWRRNDCWTCGSEIYWWTRLCVACWFSSCFMISALRQVWFMF